MTDIGRKNQMEEVENMYIMMFSLQTLQNPPGVDHAAHTGQVERNRNLYIIIITNSMCVSAQKS